MFLRIMILIDSDLVPDFAPPSSTAKRLDTSAGREPASRVRLPSARTLSSFVRRAQVEVRLRGKVTVFLTTDKEIRRLNRQFRGFNKPTDVLSFPASEAVADAVAGDLAISVHTAAKQATEQGHALNVEVKILILHGLLHLVGYDHETDSGQMARREQELRARMGLPQGLIERTSLPKGPGSRKSRGRKA